MFRRRFNLRRILRRRPLRPEVKWLDNFNTQSTQGASITPNNTYQSTLTPGSIAQGVTKTTRVGNKVKYRYVKVNVTLTCLPGLTYTNYIARARLVIYSSRVDSAAVTAYQENNMTNDLKTGFVDTNLLHVYHDKEYTFGNFISATANLATGQTNCINLSRTIPFPRTVQFREGSNDIIDGRDRLYIACYNVVSDAVNPTAPLYIYHRARTTFVDA